MTPSRRDFLYAAGVAGVGLTAPLTMAQPPAPRVRKDIATLNDKSPDIVALRTAVAIMKDKPPVPNLSWTAQAEIHGYVNDGFNKCQHRNWFFAPWHRMYVYFFEQIVAALGKYPGFALPYWDWTRHPTLPDLFWAAPFNDPTREVTKGEKISQGDYDTYVSNAVISGILGQASFNTFGGGAGRGGQLEGTPHNFIHRWVGGDMATAGSPTDPVFWLHHCNVDRLYEVWIRKHPGRLPPETAWTDKQFNDFYTADGKAGAGLIVKNTNNPTALGYTYDRVEAGLVASVPRPLPELVSVEGPLAKPEVKDGVAVYTLTPRGAVAAAVRQVVGGTHDPRSTSVQLELSGVKVPANQNVRLSVFINAPNPGPELPSTDPHHVATFTFFDGPHAAKKGDHAKEAKDEHGKEGTITLSADATGTLIRLFGDAAFGANETLKVQVVAAPLFPTRKNRWMGTVQDVSPAEVRLVVSTPKAVP
jgi:hypothetical protein